MKLITFVCAVFLCLPSLAQEKFPDGTPVSDWFKDSKIVDINTLGKKYILTDYGVINDSTLLQTEKIQSAIDAATTCASTRRPADVTSPYVARVEVSKIVVI